MKSFVSRTSWLALSGMLAAACSDESTADSPIDPSASSPDASSPDASSNTPNGDAGDASSIVDGGGDGGGPDTAAPPVPKLVVARESLATADLGVLVNDDDPQSVAVATHYAQARGIPAANIIHLQLGASFASAKTQNVDSATFTGWKQQIDTATPAGVQAYAVTWTYPTQVDCMSLTSALAFGFDMKWCATPCNATAPSPYFDTKTSTPFTTHALRPAMVIAGLDTAAANALVDRGVAADATYPLAQGYLLRTSDVNRSVRYPDFTFVNSTWNKSDSLAFTYRDDSASGTGLVENATDVLFYFTGLADVPGIASNTYKPGAIADHLTSYGGQVPVSGHMSALRWIEAGATASFGTVVEPCNYTTKFPQASKLVAHYFAGDTIIEAYWKSVNWPGEGLFIGEPLARPFGTTYTLSGDTLTIRTTALVPGSIYRVESATAESGPWTIVVGGISVAHPQLKTIPVTPATALFYRITKA